LSDYYEEVVRCNHCEELYIIHEPYQGDNFYCCADCFFGSLSSYDKP